MSEYILGIDVSNNNGNIDFSGTPNDGVQIVYVKATEGNTFRDSYMETFYNSVKAHGMKVGAYHFLVGGSSPESQADAFYAKIKNLTWDCIPMLDVETNFDELSDYVVRFKARFESLSPLTLGLYSYTSFISYIADVAATIKDMPFWEANYNDNPWDLADTFFTNRIGHQYTEKGKISGITSEGCDLDSFTSGVYITDTTFEGSWVKGLGANSNKWWYEHIDGTWTSNGWEKVNGQWYRFNIDGWMEYDWKKDGDNWYFLGNCDDGAMKVGWVKTDSKWYYFDTDGEMIIGWKQISDDWYYFSTNGDMQTFWINVDSKDYYCYSTGQMAHDIEMDGYSFASSGEATKIS